MSDLFDMCFGSYSPASEVLKSFPDKPGIMREDAIVAAAQRGDVPYFNRQWVEVPVDWKGVTCTIWVTPDYFSIGTDEDFVRMPMTFHTAQAIGSLVGGTLPTAKVVDAIHVHASQKLAAQPWGPPYDASMMSTGRFVAHNKRIQAQFNSKGYQLGVLTSGHKKDLVVTPGMDEEHVCIYGWFRNSSPHSAIQGPTPNCKSHGIDYVDYSHGVRLMSEVMLVDGDMVSVAEFLSQ